MPNGQFVVGRGRLSNGPEVFVEQAQGGVLDQTFGIGAGVGGDLRELRFLLGCEMDFHALRILEKRPSGNGVELKEPGRAAISCRAQQEKSWVKLYPLFCRPLVWERGGRYRRAFRFSVHGE